MRLFKLYLQIFIFLGVSFLIYPLSASTNANYKESLEQLAHKLQQSERHNTKHKIDAIEVYQAGETLLSAQFNNENSIHDMRSVTKSVIGLLTGIAIEQGFIKSIDDSIFNYLPIKVTKNFDQRKQQIQISHLLNMSTGLDCNDWDKKSKGNEERISKKKDWLQQTINLKQIHDSGKVSAYCTMTVNLLAEVIAQSANMEIDEFAERFFFSPLNIEKYHWGHSSKKQVIPSGKRLYLSTKDMIKIGQLFLNEGKYSEFDQDNNKLIEQQIVSEKWLTTLASIENKIGNMPFGYLWWKINFNNPKFEKPKQAISATGNGGQYIFIFKELNAVVVFTGHAYNQAEDKIPLNLVNEFILPILIENHQPRKL